MIYRSKLVDLAIEVAAVAHQSQHRKGSTVPYIAHPFAVGMILARAGCDDEVVAAGILHDILEDTDITLEVIEEKFGNRVAQLVAAASEPDKSLAWEERKRHTLDFLKTAQRDIRMLVCADKLHNVRSIRRDIEAIGESVWEKFNRGKCDQEWYYTNIVESLGYKGGFKLLDELREEVDFVFGRIKTVDIPDTIKPDKFFDIIFNNTYNFPGVGEWATEAEKAGLLPMLELIHNTTNQIRRDGRENIESMHDYLYERGVRFEYNSEGTEMILAYCVALKKLFGLYNYQLWPHFKRNLKKGVF
jgi:hypothetical protein